MSASQAEKVLSEIKTAIDASDVVSFDIFETLVWRIYERPTDLFKHIEISTGSAGFALERRSAEEAARHEARDDGHHEVTLDEIYFRMEPPKQLLKQVEIDQELTSCRRDPIGYKAYDYAIESGKTVFLASDMYLPEDVIQRILTSAGYTRHHRFLLSSATRRPKATGAMFDEMIGLAGVPADRILHIGDNYHSDYLMPKKAGLKAYLYVSALEIFGGVPERRLFAELSDPKVAASPASSLIKGLIAQSNATNDETGYWETFGYRYGGPVAVGFCQWIKDQCEKYSIKHALFMARDGFAFKNVFDALYPDRHSSYLLASRRCYLLAALKRVDSGFLSLVVNEAALACYDEPWTYADFLQQLALDSAEINDAFHAAFPDPNAPVNTPEQMAELRDFFISQEAALLKVGAQERQTLMTYFSGEGLFDERVALVDLGWKGTLVKNIRELCSLGGQRIDPICLYFATHTHDSAGASIISYALHQSRPADSILNKNIAVLILEMLFSSPDSSIVKLSQHGTSLVPLYQDSTEQEVARVAALNEMHKGILRFAQDYANATHDLPLHIPSEVAVAPLTSICDHVEPIDQHHFSSVSFASGLGNSQRYEPIYPRLDKQRIGLITPWPGTLCAEHELMLRITRAIRNIGAEPVAMSSGGYMLNRLQEQTGDVADQSTLAFAISLHYVIPKIVDTFTYMTLWNPPEIPTGTPTYNYDAQHYVMYDDYLSAGSPRIANHLRSILINSPRNIDNLSELYLSFPEDAMLEPNLSNPTMFYCGMNWEKLVYGDNARHDGLFKLLDSTGRVKFFGPKKIEHVSPWEGFRSYQGPIPFDGFSILDEINKCGVVLVLASEDHRRSQIATTRLYEACAGGAVIITDDNPFVVEHFKDAALVIEYNKHDPRGTYQKVMEKFDWIRKNPDEALQLARRAQALFRERFTLEAQLRTILAHHPKRQDAVAQSLYARDYEAVILAFYLVDQPSFDHVQRGKLAQVIENIRRQVDQSIVLAIACDESIRHFVELFCETTASGIKVVVMAMNVFDRKGGRLLTLGQAFLAASQRNEHAYFLFPGPNEIWYRDHIATLKRTLEDHPDAFAAVCGRASAERNGARSLNRFGPLRLTDVFQCVDVLPGEVLFTAKAQSLIEPFCYEFLDGIEHYALLLFSELKREQIAVFSKRVTFAVAYHLPGRGEPSLKLASQVRFVQGLVHYEMGVLKAKGFLEEGVRHQTAAEAQSGDDARLRGELDARTRELATTRDLLVERTEVLNKDLADVRETLIDRTYVAEELLRDLTAAREELAARQTATDNLQAEISTLRAKATPRSMLNRLRRRRS